MRIPQMPKQLPNLSIPVDHSMADWYHERIELQIKELSKEIDSKSEIIATVVLNDGSRIQATWFGYHNPNMLVIDGIDASGNEVRILAPHTNIQIILIVRKIKEVKSQRRIGFQTRHEEPNNE